MYNPGADAYSSEMFRSALEEIHARIAASTYKTWQVYYLFLAGLCSTGVVYDIEVVTSTLQLIESATSRWDWLVVLGIQGVLIGFIAEGLYEQGDGYAKAASHLFGSKDRTLFVRIGVMTVFSGILTKVVPLMLARVTDYLVIQTTGAVIVLGILLVHESSTDWNRRTEWPAIVAGALIALVPSIV